MSDEKPRAHISVGIYGPDKICLVIMEEEKHANVVLPVAYAEHTARQLLLAVEALTGDETKWPNQTP